jgi:hypothetical protein
MLVFLDVSLKELDVRLVEVREGGESATEPALAGLAVTNHGYDRMRSDTVANGTA